MVQSDIQDLDFESILHTAMSKKTLKNWQGRLFQTEARTWERTLPIISMHTKGRLYQVGAFKPKQRCPLLKEYASGKNRMLLNVNESQSIIQIIIQAYMPFPRILFF